MIRIKQNFYAVDDPCKARASTEQLHVQRASESGLP